jgi:DNA-binding MarR family transcriptional regulator
LAEGEDIKAGFASGRLDMARFVLIMVFLIEQRWRYVVEKDMEPDGITAKQWLMAIVVANGFKTPPSIQEVADAMSTTHQNVKQVADSMEKRGFMRLWRDEKNKRIIRMQVTDRCLALFKGREEKDVQTILSMFDNLTDEEVTALFNIIAKMEHQASLLYGSAKAARSGRVKEE